MRQLPVGQHANAREIVEERNTNMQETGISEIGMPLRLGRIARVWWTLSGLLSLLACLAGPTRTVAQSLSKGKGDLRVMTYNVNGGTDYLEIQQARALNQFPVAVGQTITQVRVTNSPERMQAVAKQIIAPDAAAQHSNSTSSRNSRMPWRHKGRTTPSPRKRNSMRFL